MKKFLGILLETFLTVIVLIFVLSITCIGLAYAFELGLLINKVCGVIFMIIALILEVSIFRWICD